MGIELKIIGTDKMKINSLIKRLQDISKKRGNVEVFIADRYISSNHQYGEIKDFDFYKHWYETKKSEKEGILIGAEDPYDSEPPYSGEYDREDEYE